MPLHEYVGGSPSTWGHCWVNHLVGMAYSDGKTDVKWSTLMGVIGGISNS